MCEHEYSDWLCASGPVIIRKKSAFILIPPKLNNLNPEIKLSYGDSTITGLDSIKYLGVSLDKKLDFKLHVENMVSKLSKSIGILSKLRYVLPSSTLHLLYFSLVHPQLYFTVSRFGVAHSLLTLLNYNDFKIKQSESSQTHFLLLSRRNFINLAF